jgi:hypothetical protein
VLWTHTNCPSAMFKALPGSRTNGRKHYFLFSMNFYDGLGYIEFDFKKNKKLGKQHFIQKADFIHQPN